MTANNELKDMLTLSPRELTSINETKSMLEEVRSRFQRSPYRELRDVQCDFHEGVLTLRGQVPSCFLKQIAQSIVFSMERIDTIDNRLEIVER